MKPFLWLLAMAAGLGTMIWLVPPREIERRLRLETEKPHQQRLETEQPKHWPVVCPVAPPCWKDGKPIVGAL